VAAVIAYLPGLLLWRYVARRFVAGHPIDAVGLRIRWVDLGWGPLTWLAAVVAEVVVGNLIVALKVPFVSNTDAFGDLHHRRGYVLALLLLAVVIAPVVEEIIFRGLLQRGLLSALPPWLAIAVQGLLFGAAHVSPERGMGNIGLALVLGAVGVVFGATAYLTRRLAPTMVAHAIVNAVAMAVVLSR
jgi:membrane protease YdiL (CAAX protease family)